MYLLLSGEGPTDMGEGRIALPVCEGSDFLPGPMAVIVDRICAASLGYSVLPDHCGFVAKIEVARQTRQLRTSKKQLGLPGRKRPKETRYFFNNARALARLAQEKSQSLNDHVIAVLFRDADGTASGGRGVWEQKRQSMLDGFREEGFDAGVPMLPKPKSEAWLICAWKKDPYRGCETLEERSGNDSSPNNLKDELQGLLEDKLTPEVLREKIDQSFDLEKIRMPSFKAFRDRLEEVIG